jgi:hypothetical protein
LRYINRNRTFPTTYVAYSPFLVQETAKGKPVAKCVTQTTAIPLPGTATAQLVFPQTDRNPTPGFASVFALLDSLPTVSAMLDGGDPADCFQGLPATTSALVITAPPEIPPAMVSVYTTVSVLTHVGDPVTLAPDPVHGPPGPPPTGPVEPHHPPPPATATATALPEAPAPPPGDPPPAGTAAAVVVVAGGVTVSRDAAGGVVAGGATLPAGAAATVGGVAVSVGPGGAVLVAGSSVDLPAAAASSRASGAARGVPMDGIFVDWRAVGWIALMCWAFLFRGH